MQRRTLLAATGAVALAAPRIARAQGGGAGGPHVVGTLFPMAGPNAEYGTIFTNGAQLALDHINADQLSQRPIELRAVDSQSTPQGGAVGMTRLANVERAVYVLVGFTGVSKAAAPIGTRAKVVMVNGGGIGPDLAGLSPYFWNVIPLVNVEIQAVLPWIKEQRYRRMAMIYVDDPAGNGIVQEFRRGLPGIGAEMVAAHSIPPASQQFAAVAARVRDSNPDVVYFASYGAQQSQIIKQLRDNGITQPLMTYSAGSIPSVGALPEAEGLVYTSQVSDWSAQDPVTRRFVEGWRAKHGGDPTAYHQNYYNAMLLFGLLTQAVEKNGKPVNGENLREEMLRTRRFAMVGGEGVFDDAGTLSLPMQINRIRGGRSERIA